MWRVVRSAHVVNKAGFLRGRSSSVSTRCSPTRTNLVQLLSGFAKQFSRRTLTLIPQVEDRPDRLPQSLCSFRDHRGLACQASQLSRHRCVALAHAGRQSPHANRRCMEPIEIVATQAVALGNAFAVHGLVIQALSIESLDQLVQ